MSKNEKTSKKVASEASMILHDADILISEISQSQRVMSDAIKMLKRAKIVAASALTQTEDKDSEL